MNSYLQKILKIIFSAAAFAAALYILTQRIPYDYLGKTLSYSLQHPFLVPSLVTIFILWLLNLYIESLKWQSLQKKIRETSLLSSLKGVLVGIGISLFLPNRSGEFLGKAAMMPKKLFPQASALAILNSLSQMFATIAFGCTMLMVVLYTNDTMFSQKWLIILIGIFAIMAMLMILFSFHLAHLSSLFGKRAKLKAAFDACRLVSLKHNIKLIVLSLFRYLVFSTQTIIALRISGVQEPYWILFEIVAVAYVLMVFMPVITIAEVPVRAGAFIFALHLVLSSETYIPTSYEAAVTVASFAIWVQNVFLSGILGITVLAFHKREGRSE